MLNVTFNFMLMSVHRLLLLLIYAKYIFTSKIWNLCVILIELLNTVTCYSFIY